MNILIINGSPRKDGLISSVLEAIITSAQLYNQIEIIQLASLHNLIHCKGCMTCQKTGHCIIRDDIVLIEEAIKRSHILILATPTHWGNMSALMLCMFERLFGFLLEERPNGFPKAKNALGKKAVLVTACSTPWPFNWIFNQSRGCFGRLREICQYSGIRIIDTLVLPGTKEMKAIPERYLLKAQAIGRSMHNA